jgi:hypothetical protein
VRGRNLSPSRFQLHGGAQISSLKTVSNKEPYENPNLKWITRDLKSASNRVPIWETYFGLPERHNPNIGILSP